MSFIALYFTTALHPCGPDFFELCRQSAPDALQQWFEARRVDAEDVGRHGEPFWVSTTVAHINQHGKVAPATNCKARILSYHLAKSPIFEHLRARKVSLFWRAGGSTVFWNKEAIESLLTHPCAAWECLAVGKPSISILQIEVVMAAQKDCFWPCKDSVLLLCYS